MEDETSKIKKLASVERLNLNMSDPMNANLSSIFNNAFCSHSFEYACLRRLRHTVMKRFEIMEKFYSSKALLKMAGGGTPHIAPPPGSATDCRLESRK